MVKYLIPTEWSWTKVSELIKKFTKIEARSFYTTVKYFYYFVCRNFICGSSYQQSLFFDALPEMGCLLSGSISFHNQTSFGSVYASDRTQQHSCPLLVYCQVWTIIQEFISQLIITSFCMNHYPRKMSKIFIVWKSELIPRIV